VLDDSTWLQPFVGQCHRDLLQVQVAQSIEIERVSPKQQDLHPCPAVAGYAKKPSISITSGDLWTIRGVHFHDLTAFGDSSGTAGNPQQPFRAGA
jgi:hypothetical protein